MEPLDTIILSITGIAVAVLLGSIWPILAASPDKKDLVKSYVRSFSKFTLVMVIAALLYYMPTSWVVGAASWVMENPSAFKVIIFPIYGLAVFLLYKILRRIWS